MFALRRKKEPLPHRQQLLPIKSSLYETALFFSLLFSVGFEKFLLNVARNELVAGEGQ